MERSNKLSVTQLNNYVKGVFDDELILKNIAVFGEVYECSSSGGNLFFTLKDEDSILRCVRFGGGYSPPIGETVTVVGSVDYYVKGNRVSFVAKSVEPFGEGTLKRKLRELYERLKADGAFDNRPPLPKFIRRVAIITSETGAVIHDFLSVIRKSHAYIDVVLYPVRVQGDGASNEIADAVKEASLSDCDVIVVARGGGSNTDLDAFNEENVARAVSASQVPVISAVGHQVDYTLCDYAASLRAGTPSIAGENVCRINEAFIARFYDCLAKMDGAITAIYRKNRVRACYAAKRLTDDAFTAFYGGRLKLNNYARRLTTFAKEKEELARRNVSALMSKTADLAEKSLSSYKNALTLLSGRLDAASPLKIISNGYAKVYRNNVPLASVGDVAKGDELEVVVADGIIAANVVNTRKSVINKGE